MAWPDVAGWSHIETPMSADVWDEQLVSHLDATYWAFLVKGLREGSGLVSGMDQIDWEVLLLTCNLQV